MLRGSSEVAIFICFDLGVWAKNPLAGNLKLANPSITFPISFFYGDRDWMDQKSGELIVNVN